VSCAKTAEPIGMLFGFLARMGPRNGIQVLPWEAEILRGERAARCKGMLRLCCELWNKSSAVAEMGNRGHNRHGPKIGLGAVRRIMQIMPLDFRFLMPRISNRVTPNNNAKCRWGKLK